MKALYFWRHLSSLERQQASWGTLTAAYTHTLTHCTCCTPRGGRLYMVVRGHANIQGICLYVKVVSEHEHSVSDPTRDSSLNPFVFGNEPSDLWEVWVTETRCQPRCSIIDKKFKQNKNVLKFSANTHTYISHIPLQGCFYTRQWCLTCIRCFWTPQCFVFWRCFNLKQSQICSHARTSTNKHISGLAVGLPDLMWLI